MRQKGFYWVKFANSPDDDWTVGYYDGEGNLSWQIIASDEIFHRDVFIVGERIERGNGQ